MKILFAAPVALLAGCMAANPSRPVLTCSGECTYYGPQQPDPRVEMARVLTGGLTSIGGIIVGGDVLKSLSASSGTTNTIERTTNNSTDRASSVNNTSVSDRSSTSVTDTSINNTSVSNTSSNHTIPGVGP